MPRSRSSARRRPARRPARRPVSRARVWMRRAVAVAALGAVLACGYMLWLRDSSLVAVTDVRVVGAKSAERAQIRDSLAQAARGMTTLHVREQELADAVSSYSTVESVSASPRYPNGLTIEVRERAPVALLDAEGRDLPVAGDGTVLAGIPTAGLDLPALEGETARSGRRLAGEAAQGARVLGASPGPLLPLVERASADADGVVVELSDDITLTFGDASDAEVKWAAAARILADEGLSGVGYIDLRAPERPAVGGAAASAGST